MKSEYKRDMNHNYLILTGEEAIDTDSYQVRMIVANAVPDLLQCRIQGIDGKFMVYYDVTSRHSVSALFEDKKIGMEELQVILGGFIQVMEAMSEYLLNPCQLILDPQYIYMDAEKKNIRFCYMPGFHGEIQKQFQELAEYILPRLDHEDGKAVMLGYGVYRRALEDSFHLEHIKEELYKVSNGSEEEFRDYEKKSVSALGVKRELREEKQEELWEMENWERNDEKEKNRKNKNRTKIWKYAAGSAAAAFVLLAVTVGMALGYLPRIGTEVFLGIILGLMILGMISYLLIKKISGREKRAEVQKSSGKIQKEVKKEYSFEEEEKKNQKGRKNEEKTAEEEFAEDTVWREEKTEKVKRKKKEEDGFGETVVLSANVIKGPATLVSREPGELATIYLDKDIIVIGKMETAADAVINIPTVSRIHAKIRRRDGKYYLTDLNSRNGTSVNGKILKTGEEYLLENEDEIDFAQARYIFLE